MERKQFIRNLFVGTGVLAATASFGNALRSAKHELNDLVGFNQLPSENPTVMINTVLHKANARGHANHGWLDSHHSFSFANYYDPERMHFGVLRVLNDDVVAAGMGFGPHPHDNMEIISIPLEGDLQHQDSIGTRAVIKRGDIQVMSAGTGVRHSEYNANADKPVKFLQIWVMPNQRNATPRYDQITLNESDRKNTLQQILSPNLDDAGVWIHQDAWFHLGNLDKGKSVAYNVKRSGNGVYTFVLNGDVTVNGIQLNKRDGLGVWNTDKLDIVADSDAEVLLMDVPMEA
jgi:quercetin 2,3-dioxygenase